MAIQAITPRGDYNGQDVMMRWRERGDRWGGAPPATASMVKSGAAFSLRVKAQQNGVTETMWEAHVAYMRLHHDVRSLAAFYLDYIADYEAWEQARTQKGGVMYADIFEA